MQIKNTFITTIIAIVISAQALQAATYVITGSSGSFTAKLDGETIGTAYVGITQIMNSIKADALGKDCTIKFGNGSEVLDIEGSQIVFGGGDWGLVTLEGKITAANPYYNYSTVEVNNGVSIKSTADIANTKGGNAIEHNSTGSVTINGGTVQAIEPAIRNNSSGKITISGNAKVTSAVTGKDVITGTDQGTIYLKDSGSATAERLVITGGTVENTAANGNAIFNASTGAVTISGGTVSVTNGTAVSGGTITISGGTVSATNGTAVKGSTIAIKDNGMVLATTGTAISGGTVTISGGEVSASGNIVSDGTNLVLGGNPSITGVIKTELGKLSLVASGSDKFVPAASKIYTLNIISSYLAGNIVVPNGKDYLSNFKLQSQCYALSVSGEDIVIGQRLATCPYVITSSANNYNVTIGGSAMTSATTIQGAINNIKTDAAGKDCTIQFGNGSSTLNISNNYITFDGGTNGTDWGLITLEGKITSNYSSSSNSGTIYLNNNASIKSTGDITNTNGIAIYNNSTGTVTISGGNISAKLNAAQAAVYNNSAGKIIISSGAISKIDNGSGAGYVVSNNSTGEVTISGGTMQATAGVAVYNKSSGKITVSGSAKITSQDTDSNGGTILNDGTGTVEIKGGTVEYTGHNSYNGIKTVNNAFTGTLLISGGIISTTSDYAVYNASGTVTISGGLLFAYKATAKVIEGTELSGNALIVKWNEGAGRFEYTLGTDRDIYVEPETATAVWSKKDGYIGIAYANNLNTGFYAPATLPTLLSRTQEPWGAYTDKPDKGASTIGNENLGTADNPNYVVVMKDVDDSVAKIKSYTLSKGANPNEPYVGLYLSAEKNGTDYDLSKCINGFRYAYKGASHDFRAESKLVTDYSYHRLRVSSSSVWKTQSVIYEQLTQENWGTSRTLNFGDIERFAWQMKGDFSATTGELSIKDFFCLGNMPLQENTGGSSSSLGTSSSSSGETTPSSSSIGNDVSSSSDGSTFKRLPQIATSNNVAKIANGISLAVKSNAVVGVYGLNGNLISRQIYANGVYSVSLKHLPKGMYIVKVSFGNHSKILRVPVIT
jgi:hypothetical protein